MDNNQLSNITKLADSITEHLFNAWNEYHLLLGLYEQGKLKPEILKAFASIWMRTYGASWDGILLKIASLLDRRPDVHSLPRLINDLKRYNAGDSVLLGKLSIVESRTLDVFSRAEKMSRWRHEVIAHRTDSGLNADFYVQNKVSLVEAHEILTDCGGIINDLSTSLLGRHYDFLTESKGLQTEIERLFLVVEEGLALKKSTMPLN